MLHYNTSRRPHRPEGGGTRRGGEHMSYLNQAQDPRRRATAMVTVGAVHALLAAGLLTGLAVNFDKIVDNRLIGVTVPLEQPKPEPTPTPTAEPVKSSYVP